MYFIARYIVLVKRLYFDFHALSKTFEIYVMFACLNYTKCPRIANTVSAKSVLSPSCFFLFIQYCFFFINCKFYS